MTKKIEAAKAVLADWRKEPADAELNVACGLMQTAIEKAEARQGILANRAVELKKQADDADPAAKAARDEAAKIEAAATEAAAAAQ